MRCAVEGERKVTTVPVEEINCIPITETSNDNTVMPGIGVRALVSAIVIWPLLPPPPPPGGGGVVPPPPEPAGRKTLGPEQDDVRHRTQAARMTPKKEPIRFKIPPLKST